MRNKLGIIAAALAVVFFSSTLAVAQAAKPKPTGTVVAVETAVVKIKGADGKTYEAKMADVIEKNLKTGDMVEYEVIEGQPVKVAKKKM